MFGISVQKSVLNPFRNPFGICSEIRSEIRSEVHSDIRSEILPKKINTPKNQQSSRRTLNIRCAYIYIVPIVVIKIFFRTENE